MRFTIPSKKGKRGKKIDRNISNGCSSGDVLNIQSLCTLRARRQSYTYRFGPICMRMRRGEEVCAEASLDNHPFLPHAALAFASRLADFPRPRRSSSLKRIVLAKSLPSLSLPTNYEIPFQVLSQPRVVETFFPFFFFFYILQKYTCNLFI